MPVFAFLGLVFRRLPQHPNHLSVILIFKRTIRRHRLVSHTLATGVIRHRNNSPYIVLPVPDRRFQRGSVMRNCRANINIRTLVQQTPNSFRLSGRRRGNQRGQGR